MGGAARKRRVAAEGAGGAAAARAPPTSKEARPNPLLVGIASLLSLSLLLLGLAVPWWLLRDDAPAATQGAVGAEPAVYGYRLVQRYHHDPEAFTQGLLWANGSLYESTGLYRRSSVREIRLGEEGAAEVVRQVRLDDAHFGEGLVHRSGELLQLLWRRPDVLRFSARAGPGGHLERLPGELRTPLKDGWGLEAHGGALLATDSGPDVFHLDPETFALRRAVRVMDGTRVVEMINELEVVDGELWANVFGTECLARVDPDSGAVRGWVVLQGLLDRRAAGAQAKAAGRAAPDVLNGIAWDAARRRLFVTGKLWPALFEIEVVPTPAIGLEAARSLCIPAENLFRPSAGRGGN